MTVSTRSVHRTTDGRVEILERDGRFEVVVDQWIRSGDTRPTLAEALVVAEQRWLALPAWDATDRDPLYVTVGDGENVFVAEGLSGSNGPMVRNYADAYHWNGWVVPLFSEAVARQVCAAFSDPDYGTFTFQDDGTILVDESPLYPDDDPATLISTWHPTADGLYAVGDSWTWQIAEVEPCADCGAPVFDATGAGDYRHVDADSGCFLNRGESSAQ